MLPLLLRCCISCLLALRVGCCGFSTGEDRPAIAARTIVAAARTAVAPAKTASGCHRQNCHHGDAGRGGGLCEFEDDACNWPASAISAAQKQFQPDQLYS